MSTPAHASETRRTDTELVENSLAILAQAGLTPTRPVTLRDINIDGTAGILERFRAYPLTTLLSLRDLNEDPLFSGVFVDYTTRTRNSYKELTVLLQELALAAGTLDQLHSLTVMFDSDSTESGSFRVTLRDRVHDISFDFNADPCFGDPGAESAMAHAVAPENTETHVLYRQPFAESMVVWAPSFCPQLCAEGVRITS